MQTSPTDSLCRAAGFTLLELMVVLAIGALMVGVVLPVGARMYDTMTYRDAVRQISEAVHGARYRAITSGEPVDLVFEPDAGRFLVKPAAQPVAARAMAELSGDLRFSAVTAREVSPGQGLAAIRFYPGGGSTGGSLSVQRANGSGVRLRVDWLLGRVSQEALDLP